MDTTLKLDEMESCAQFQMVGVEIESPRVMQFFFGSRISPGGYAWVFPKGADMANVGVGVLGSLMQRPPIEYLKDFVNSKEELRKGKTVEINGGAVPVGGPLPRTVKGNLLIVGDAARQVNPLTGGGIDSAMRAGNIAGEVAARAVAEGDVSEKRLEEYEQRWRGLLGEKLERYLRAKQIFLDMSDNELDDLARALQGVELEQVGLTNLLNVISRISSKLLEKLAGL